MLVTNESIQYAGFVTIKEFMGNKLLKTTRLHNAGTNWLFQVLAHALTGSDQSMNMPKFFDMGILNSDSSSFNSILNARVGLTSEVIERYTPNDFSTETYGYSTKFTAVIPASNLVNSEANCFVLASAPFKEQTNVLAKIITDDTIAYKKLLGYSYIIEWVMTFTNTVS